jgi:L-amino acid N-acyltransferase YncA
MFGEGQAESFAVAAATPGLLLIGIHNAWDPRTSVRIAGGILMIPRDGLIAEYLFSGNVQDTSGRGHHGVVHGATPCPDRFGAPDRAYRFDGVDDFIEVTPPPALNDRALTVSVWARFDRRPLRGWTNCIVAQDNGNDADQSARVFQLSTDHHHIVWHRMVGARDPMCKRRVRFATWYHLVATYDAGEHRLYLDGVWQDTVRHRFWTHATQPLHIGRKGADERFFFFKGAIDDLRIYERALAPDEVAALFRESGFAKAPPPAGEDVSGRWGQDGVVFLDLAADDAGRVSGKIMAGRPDNMADVASGTYDRANGRLRLEGVAKDPDSGKPVDYVLDGGVADGEAVMAAEVHARDGSFDYSGNHVLTRRGARRRRWRDSTLRDVLMRARIRGQRIVWGRTRHTKAENARLFESRGETIASFVIRDAAPADIPALARLHVTAWNAAYATSSGPTVELRERQWRETFAKPSDGWFVLVVVDPKGALVGFTRGIRRRDGTGDFNKLYLLPAYQRFGLGTRLVGHLVRRFLAMGVRSISGYVEPGNPSGAFFEHIGGHWGHDPHGRVNYSWYVWDNLDEIAARCPIE